MNGWALNSSLPPLKCTYEMAPINEEQPYVAMEEMTSDTTSSRYAAPNNDGNARFGCCPFSCFGF